MTTLHQLLLLSVTLFGAGLLIVLTRRNAILVLVGIELMLGAANLNFVAFWRYAPQAGGLEGVLFALFAIAVAAGEAAVGLALVLLVYRHFRTVDLGRISGGSCSGAEGSNACGDAPERGQP